MTMTGRSRKGQSILEPTWLLKVIALERQRGFDNRAVTIGTARVLLRWLEPAAAAGRSARTRQRLGALAAAVRGYPGLDRQSRAEVLSWVEAELQRLVKPQEDPSPHAPVSVLDGIGPRRALALSVAGIHTVEDLLLTVPKGYLDAGRITPVVELQAGQTAIIGVRVTGQPVLRHGPRASRVEVMASDQTGQIVLVFFNQPYRAQQLQPGEEVLAAGRAAVAAGRRVFVVKRVLKELADAREGMIAEYRIGDDLPESVIRRAVAQALQKYADGIKAVAPPSAARATGLVCRPESFVALHRPRSLQEAEIARRSFVLDQLLALQVRLLQHRHLVRRPSPECRLDVRGL
ncbi:MAG: hypothetical protein H5T86_09615, partial [Armatimonadetes bacterium]|nr:hypothetical protein [Armatimonadota bacterium]